MPLFEYAPDEIKFLPLMKKSLMGTDAKTSLAIIRYSATLLCVMPKGQNFFEGGIIILCPSGLSHQLLDYKFKRGVCTQKPVFNICFKDFW